MSNYLFRRKRSLVAKNATAAKTDEDLDSSEMRVYEYYESHKSTTINGPHSKPKQQTNVHRAKLVRTVPQRTTTTAAPSTSRPTAKRPSITRKRRIRINPTTATTNVRTAGEVDDLSDDKFFFHEQAKTQPPPARESDDVEIYRRPDVDKGIVFVQQHNPSGERFRPQGPTKQKHPRMPATHIAYDVNEDDVEADTIGSVGSPKHGSDAEFVDNDGEEALTVDDDDDHDYDEVNADFEIVEDETADDGGNERENFSIFEYRDSQSAVDKKALAVGQRRPKKVRGKHYVRRFESPEQLYAEIDKIINDGSSRNEQENEDDDDYWEVRIEKPHRNRAKT